jgi:hypothetical protein
MIAHSACLPAAAFVGGVPTEPVVGPATAWLWLFALLAICCAALWFLANPIAGGISEHGEPPPAGRRKPHRVLGPPWRDRSPRRRRRLARPSRSAGGRS